MCDATQDRVLSLECSTSLAVTSDYVMDFRAKAEHFILPEVNEISEMVSLVL